MYWACKRQEAHFMCCDQKARAASAQRFTLWQQETIEITQRDHAIVACSRHIYLCVALCTHSVRGDSLSMPRQLRGCNNIPSFL